MESKMEEDGHNTNDEESQEEATSPQSRENAAVSEGTPLSTGQLIAFLLFGLAGIGLTAGAVGSCSFLIVTPGGILISNDGEVYHMGLFRSDVNSLGFTYDQDLQKTIWEVRTEEAGCLPYRQGGSADGYGLYAPQQVARASALISLVASTILFLYQSCNLGGLDGEGRRLGYPLVSSVVLLFAGMFSLLSLLFLMHTWCDEEFYGTCQMGTGPILSILGGTSCFVCAGVSFFISRSVSSSGRDGTHDRNK
mmetsp:Transcript_20101/g.58142  ORF Transcript_20101/g.58142 Transcript_20101/m.58142 type:complete len:251 (-) Transcript_20101:30-782(-)